MAIYALGDLEPRIDPTAYVHPLAVVIGNVELGPEASVWPYAVLRGDDGLIRIGARSNVQDNAVIHCTPEPSRRSSAMTVTIGHQAHLEGCTVHDDSLIGVGAVVIHAARIGPQRPGGRQCNRDQWDGGATPVPWRWERRPGSARTRSSPITTSSNADIYAQRGHHYRAELRRID